MKGDVYRRSRIALTMGLLVVFLVLFVLGARPVWAQCAMCRTALTQSPEGQQLAEGFNAGILFLLAAPYVVFGTLVGSIWVSRLRRV